MRVTRYAVAVALFIVIVHGVPLWAQPAFPARAIEVVNELYAGVNPQNDDARRVSIHRTCSQLAFELGPKWGGKKRAGLSDEFRSPDSLAYLEDDGYVSVWDIQSSNGAILVHAGKAPDYPRLPPTEAAFMPCAPMNYLMPTPPPPVVVLPSPGPIVPSPGPIVVPPSIDWSRVWERLAEIDQTTKATQEDVKVIRAGMDRVWRFIGKYGSVVVGALLTGRYLVPDKPDAEPAK